MLHSFCCHSLLLCTKCQFYPKDYSMVLLLAEVGEPPWLSCSLPGLHALICTNGDYFFCPLSPSQAECIQTGPGRHVCACQEGWTGDGRDCSAINNCLLPSVAGCHENATCIYVGPGQVGPHILLTFCTSSHPFSSAGTSCPHSSPGSPLPPGHMLISTQNSLPQLPLHFFAMCYFSRSKDCKVSTLGV